MSSRKKYIFNYIVRALSCPSSLGCASHSDVLGSYNLVFGRKEGRKDTHSTLYIQIRRVLKTKALLRVQILVEFLRFEQSWNDLMTFY